MRNRLGCPSVLFLTAVLIGGAASAEDAPRAPSAAGGPAPTAPPPAGSAGVNREPGRWSFTGSWRVRQEVWDWFGDAGEDSYTFTGSLLRLGLGYTAPRSDFFAELAFPLLLNLPGDASLPPPLGQQGLATLYDISLDYQLQAKTTLSTYVGYAAGGDVIKSTFSGSSGLFTFLEVTQRW